MLLTHFQTQKYNDEVLQHLLEAHFHNSVILHEIKMFSYMLGSEVYSIENKRPMGFMLTELQFSYQNTVKLVKFLKYFKT